MMAHIDRIVYIIYDRVDGDLWDAHLGHEAPVPPHPKDEIW